MAAKGKRRAAPKAAKKPVWTPPAAAVPGKTDPLERLLSQLDEKSEQLALVNGILRTAVGASSLEDVLRVFASNVKAICPFDRMSVALADRTARVFHVPFIHFGGRVQENREPPRPFSDTPLTQVLDTRQALLRKDIAADMKFGRDREFVKLGIACEMIFPLVAGQEAFGTFQMSCFESGRLTERHLALVGEALPAITAVIHGFKRPPRG
jgi:hypothetical protein